MFGNSTKSSGETEQKRLVSKGGDDLPAIVQLQNCASDRHSFKVKIVRKQFLKSRLFKIKKLITVTFFLKVLSVFHFSESKTSDLYNFCETLQVHGKLN